MTEAKVSARSIQRGLMLDIYRRSFVLPNYTPSGWFECDVFEVTKAGFFREYEIKLSRGDFAADRHKSKSVWTYDEVTGKGKYGPPRMKHHEIQQASPRGPTRFYYVAPKDLLDVEEVPAWAGFIEAQASEESTYFKTVREAPQIHRCKLQPEVRKHALSVCYWRLLKELLHGNAHSLKIPEEVTT